MSKLQKKLLILSGVVIVLWLLFTLTPLQYLNFTIDGQSGMSKSIEESKERKVFLYEYALPSKMNHDLRGYVQQIWIEKQWSYTGYFTNNTDTSTNNYRLCLVTDKTNINQYRSSWIIELDSRHILSTFWGTANNPEPYLQCPLGDIPSIGQSLTVKQFIGKDTVVVGQISLVRNESGD